LGGDEVLGGCTNAEKSGLANREAHRANDAAAGFLKARWNRRLGVVPRAVVVTMV